LSYRRISYVAFKKNGFTNNSIIEILKTRLPLYFEDNLFLEILPQNTGTDSRHRRCHTHHAVQYYQMNTFSTTRLYVHTHSPFIQCDSLARDPKLLSIKKCISKNLWPPRSPDLTPANFFLLGPIEEQIVQKYTPHNRTTQRRYTPRDSSRQPRHFGKSIPEFRETHSSVLGCERRLVSASIMSRSMLFSIVARMCI